MVDDSNIGSPSRRAVAGLRLYVAGSTPNSVRAEHNLTMAIAAIPAVPEAFALEIIDVLTNPRRAMSDGVLVTPTLIGLSPQGRTTIMGDLTDSEPLRRLLAQLGRNSP